MDYEENEVINKGVMANNELLVKSLELQKKINHKTKRLKIRFLREKGQKRSKSKSKVKKKEKEPM